MHACMYLCMYASMDVLMDGCKYIRMHVCTRVRVILALRK